MYRPTPYSAWTTGEPEARSFELPDYRFRIPLCAASPCAESCTRSPNNCCSLMISESRDSGSRTPFSSGAMATPMRFVYRP